MTSPLFKGQPLFIQPAEPVFEKNATKLSKDANSWEQEIMDALHLQFPYLADYPISVEMRKSDEDAGVGLGSIKIGEVVKLPVIVNSNRLQPLDVFIDKSGQFQALTRTSLETALQTPYLGAPVKPGETGAQTDTAMTGMVMAPYDGKYSYASAKLDIDPDHFLSVFTDTRIARPMIKAAGQRFAAHVAVPEDRLSLVMTKQASDKIVSDGKYQVSDGDVVYVAHNVLSLDDGTKSITAPLVVSLNSGQVKMASGAKLYGQRTTVDGMFKLAVNPIKKVAGVLIHRGADGLVATEPFQILGETKKGLHVKTAHLEKDIVFTSSTPGALVVTPNTVYADKSWALVPVTDDLNLSKLAHSGAELEHGDIEVRKISDTRIVVNGDTRLGKIASTSGILLEDWLSNVSPRMSNDDMIAALSKLTEGKSVFFTVDPSMTKQAAEQTLDASERENLLTALDILIDNVDLLKTASVMVSQDTVDSILGVNFLTQENMYKFVDMIPQLEDAQQVLAQLLMASRLGLPINSSPVRGAMFSVDSILNSLRELRNATISHTR